MEVKDTIDRYISDWFESIELPSHPQGLYAPISYSLESGGKRLRPALLLAATLGFGGSPEDVRNQCIGIELFHNFTLLHDDVMDNSEVRRGRPTVHRRWNTNTAILSGDAMLTLATRYISEPGAKVEAFPLAEVLNIFNRTAMEVYEGQQYDMDFENRQTISVEEYLEMIKLKTSVLLACSLKIGAIMAGASTSDAQALYDYGINLGIGFQLRDDYLDTFGDPLIFGKQIGGDILNDKKTWLMVTTNNDPEASEKLNQIRRSDLNEDDYVKAVTEVFRTLGLDGRIADVIDRYSLEAINIVKSIDIQPSVKDYLIELAERMATRAQ